MNICIPALGIDNRGGTRVLVELANRLAQRGHRLTFVIPRGTRRTTFSIAPEVSIVECGLRIPQVEDISSILRLFFLPFAVPKCDLVIANYYLTAYPAAQAVRQGRARHGAYLIQHYEPLAFGKAERTFPGVKQWLAERTYRLPFTQIAVANWIAERVRSISGQSVSVIRPGVDLTVFCPRAERQIFDGETSMLVFPGEDLWKGWADFQKAFDILAEKKPGVNVTAASRSVFSLPSSQYQAAHPQNDVELAEAYRSADLYVHPAWWEGCPLAPLEAMACGTAVVAAASEGIREYALHGKNCWLVPPKDPSALAEGMLKVLIDTALRERLVQGGLQTAKQFSWEHMTDELEHRFLAIVGESHGG